MRKDWLAFAAGLLVGLAGLFVWAWHDGGTRDLRPMSAPATLPESGQ